MQVCVGSTGDNSRVPLQLVMSMLECEEVAGTFVNFTLILFCLIYSHKEHGIEILLFSSTIICSRFQVTSCKRAQKWNTNGNPSGPIFVTSNRNKSRP